MLNGNQEKTRKTTASIQRKKWTFGSVIWNLEIMCILFKWWSRGQVKNVRNKWIFKKMVSTDSIKKFISGRCTIKLIVIYVIASPIITTTPINIFEKSMKKSEKFPNYLNKNTCRCRCLTRIMFESMKNERYKKQ